ncbi:MAG: hypothetical protein P4L83_12515 [Nevskia sp.]|nr:hypothetical protein [Nevskia sp.]
MSEYAAGEIRRLVWSGFYDEDEVCDIVLEEIFEPGEIDGEWVEQRVREEFERKAEQESAWPAVTDCDRLDQAFDDLNDERIIALQNAGYTQDDGIDDITEVYRELGGEESEVEGYCFYHGQDLERAVDGQGLLLSFGDILGDNERGLEVGHRIAEVLVRHGIEVSWSGTIDERIELPSIVWRRRFRA